ncbi:AfsR/SARP family transcriptional regulator [Kutzneria sp. CA-103260]|uniref:AfsR/SARP family transcriptional regulator n=1 Tax=Kutzneria sp. CA-103260 TaxID=2802641 RepID=UPI001BA832FF|nr:BTAD domain-containing putative transcriptional regulator [Kutzneria sp. CA-103260]
MTIIEETTHLRIGLLGPVRAWRGGAEVAVGPPRQQALLAVLATNANQVISRAELIDAIWGTEPPASAVGSVHTYVAGLRRALEPARKTFQVLVSAGSGYSLRVEPDDVDAERFARHRQAARQLSGNDPDAALAELDRALALWSGTPLGSIGGPFADVERHRLAELRLDVVEERADLLLTLGRPAEVVSELKTVLDDHPLRESSRALLIRALHQHGRTGEAKSVYQAGARLLDDRLGVQPGPALRSVYDTLLNTAGPAEDSLLPRVVPSQLPHDTRRFTGRGEELRRLDALLPVAGAVSHGGTVVITTIEGTAGIGKTSLAVHWSHLVRDLFPDGQIYLNLRGFDVADKPVQPHDALFTLLSAFRVPAEKIPRTTAERTVLLRNVVAGRRMLMVLDNAVSTDQVTPLLPANQSCVVLVTSRNRLDGLVATGDSQQLTLGLFDEVDSAALLASYLSPERVDEEREAFDELLALCAGLPLALSIVGARAWCSPNLPLAQFVDELRDDFRLDALDTGDDAASSVRAVFSWSYAALSPEAKRMFRRLGLHAGPDVSRHAAGALADVTEDEARQQLDELVRAHLLELRGDGRYQFHDLLRVYAVERADNDETAAERDAAVRRSVSWYLHAANEADRKMLSFKPVHNIIDPPAHWTFHEQDDPEGVKAWFMTEETNLVEAVRRAVELAEHAVAWRLPQTLSSFWYVCNKRWELWGEMIRISLRHAVLDGDVNGQASAHGILGIIANDLRRYDEAVDHYQQAIALFPQIDEKWLVGITYNSLGHTYVSMGKLPEAMAALRTAAEAYAAIGNTWGRAWALQGTASAYNAIGDHEKALEYGHLTLEAWHDVNYTHGIGSGLNLLGEIHLAAGNYAESIDYYDQAIQARQSINDRFGIANALRGKALAELRAGRVDAARESYRLALPILTALESQDTAEVEEQLAQLDATQP